MDSIPPLMNNVPDDEKRKRRTMTATTLPLVPAPSNESFVRVSFDGDIIAITEDSA